MLLKRKGFPEENEIVLCTVTQVRPTSVFANLDEYENKSGLIYISEVSPGRIRNIRNYVVEGKKVFCKVLRITRERGHIDLSLRRVTESQKRAKNSQIKKELKVERIIINQTKKERKKPEEVYQKLAPKILEKYEYVHQCFEDVSKGVISLEELGIEKKLAQKFDQLIKEKIKPPRVVIKGKISLKHEGSNGVEIIKGILGKEEGKKVEITYLGAGNYSLEIEGEEFKKVEEVIKKRAQEIITQIEKQGGEGSFTKTGKVKEEI